MKALTPEFFDPYSDDFNHRPEETYKRLRDYPPLFFWPKGNAWVATSHSLATSVQRHQNLSTNISNWEHFNGETQGSGVEMRIRLQGIMGGSGDRHMEIKKIVVEDFMPAALTMAIPEINQIIYRKINSFFFSEEFDIVQDFAADIPISVISHLLGIPSSLKAPFFDFSNAFIELFAKNYSIEKIESDIFKTEQHLSTGIDLLEDLISDFRKRKQYRGLIGKLIRAQQEGLAISDSEMIALIAEILVGGTDTTVQTIAYGVWDIMKFPGVLDHLIRNPTKWKGAIYEIIRYESFIKFSPRFAIDDFLFDGQSIRKGQMVLALYGSAQRDPLIFPAPDSFDIHRDQSQSMAFGRSGHGCIGRHLAAIEASQAIKLLFSTFPSMTLSDEIKFSSKNRVLREMTSMRVCKDRKLN